jgi:hydrogenase nickel incorporation protein HypA/HybF
MHELAITEGVVEAVTERLPDASITCVRLEIGALSGVVADSVRFCFDLVTEGTNLEGARLEIIETAGRCRCRACGGEFEPDGPILVCSCGSADITVLSGQEFKIASVQCRPGGTIPPDPPEGRPGGTTPPDPPEGRHPRGTAPSDLSGKGA